MWLAAVCCVVGFAKDTLAEDVYYYLPLKDVTVTKGQFPTDSAVADSARLSVSRNLRGLSNFMQPYAVGDANEEIYVDFDDGRRRSLWSPRTSMSEKRSQTHIAVRSEKGKAVTGRFFLPKPDWSGMTSRNFSLSKASADQKAARLSFLRAKQRHYRNLLNMNVPGAAWFRYQADAPGSRIAGSARQPGGVSNLPPRRAGESQLQQTYSLFSGGRAISENLQLDRQLRLTSQAEQTVSVDTLEGISIAEIDWKPVVEGLQPEKDPLAAYIPADQHVLFFGSFKAMSEVIDEAKANGTPVLRLLDPRSEDAMTHQRYERQLCVSLDAWSRLFGPAVIAGVAFTGSDPYLRTGSDVAVLFETRTPLPICAKIIANHESVLSTTPSAKRVNGRILDISYRGLVSAGRTICSYTATLDKVVVVTNSLHQLEQIIKTYKQKIPNMASLDEYTFFRDRYKRNDPDESALLIITDAAIRRWCSPRWRIGASRRIRAAAAMAYVQAEHLDKLAAGLTKAEEIDLKENAAGLGKFTVTPQGITSSVYGTLDFLTPIAETGFDKVTEEEARVYKWFRDRYQRRWRQFFDPIALRFTVSENRLAADLTIRPLIASTEYRTFMDVTGEGAITAQAGDRHPEAVLHYVMAIDAKSEPIAQIGNFAAQMTPGLRISILDWLGDWATIYADADPVWGQLEEALTTGGNSSIESFVEKNIHRLPIAFEVDVSNYFKFTGFLVAVRAFIEQTAPGMTVWETMNYKDQPYVRVAPSDRWRQDDDQLQNIAVYYAMTSRGFILTLNESLVKRCIDRSINPPLPGADEEKPDAFPDSWLGKSMAIKAKSSAFAVIQTLLSENYNNVLRRRAWGNIMILNEWRRRYDQDNPVDFHQRFWQTKLVCPGGGDYVWNEKFKTMESTIFGSPARPRLKKKMSTPLAKIKEAEFGLTFEDNGLRARADITRK